MEVPPIAVHTRLMDREIHRHLVALSDLVREGPWIALRLAVALSEVGFALPTWAGLRRRYAVIKSATAAAAARPTVQQHYDSFAATLPQTPMPKIVLIDD